MNIGYSVYEQIKKWQKEEWKERRMDDGYICCISFFERIASPPQSPRNGHLRNYPKPVYETGEVFPG